MSLESVIRVFSTTQASDYSAPWQARLAESGSGSSVLVGPNQILTGAHVVADATFIQVQKVSAPDKAIARVTAICHDSDLALLTVDDQTFLNDLPQAKLGGLPQMQEHISVVGFPEGGEELSITEGVVSRIEVQCYTHSNRHLLAITVDAAINNGNSGGPVFDENGLVVGIAFQSFDDIENSGHMVPVPLIQQFLSGVEKGLPSAVPSLGIRTQSLENPTLRLARRMNPEQSGVMVRDITYGGSAWGILERGDIVLSIDGHKIANNRTVRFQGRFRTRYHALLCERYVGEQIPLEILRNGESMNVSLTLARSHPLVLQHQYDCAPTYFMVGGLVFQPLSMDYLCTWDKWWERAPRELVYEFYFGARTEERQSIVTLTQVLSDQINVGYEALAEYSVCKLNGVPPKDMADFVRRIEASKEQIEIELSSGDFIVLDTTEATASKDRILHRYRINQDRSQDLA